MTVNKDDIRRRLAASPYPNFEDMRALLAELDAKDAEIARLRDLLNKMSVIASYSGWISVKDRLPKKEERVLSYSSQMAETEADIQMQKGFMVSRKKSDITHWMPLPEPPKEVELG